MVDLLLVVLFACIMNVVCLLMVEGIFKFLYGS